MGCLGMRYISPLPGHRYLSHEIKTQSKVQKWQLKVKGSSQTLRGVGVDMPRDTRNHVTRSKGIFPERKVYI